jgi:hypothetical protein
MRMIQLGLPSLFLGAATLAAIACGSSEEKKGSNIGGSGGSLGTGANGAGASPGTGGSTSAGGNVFIPVDDGGTTPTGPDANCGGEDIESGTRPVNMLILMDRSASMDVEISAGVSRWNMVKLALAVAIGDTQDQVDYGLSLFPYDPADPTGGASCAMPTTSTPVAPIDPGTPSVTVIGDALNASEPGGGTPTAEALTLALDYFTSGAGADLEGGKFVLLATDGGPNCNDDHDDCTAAQCTTNIDGDCPDVVPNCCEGAAVNCLDDAATVAAVEALHDAGIGTFVVGMAIEQAPYQATLNSLAEAGGHPRSGDTKYFSVSDDGAQAALTSAVRAITQELITSCEQILTTLPPRRDDSLLNVDLDGERLTYEDPDGWILRKDTPDGGEETWTIVLQGDACQKVETEGARSVRVVFGCPRQIVPR